MMRLSRLSGLLMLSLLLLGMEPLGASGPVPDNDPNWYAPSGYFSSLMARLKSASKEGHTVSIVQLGDSHIQAGYTTAPIRRSLQSTYGNAGRGWIGWYSLYGSNAPKDYRVTSASLGWQRELILRPEGTNPMGVGGYVLSTRASANFSIGVSSQMSPFRQMLLLRTASSHPLGAFPVAQVARGRFSTGAYVVDTLSWSTPFSEVTLSPIMDEGDESVYAGCVLLSGKGGALVHDIGINGAAYRHYALEEYVEQLALLEPELLIISMGTNDCYSRGFQMETFTESLDTMMSLIKAILPRTKVLLTTPPPSFFRQASTHYVTTGKKRRKHRKKVTTISYQFNEHARHLSAEIMRRARTYDVAAFDLFTAMGGEQGISSWIADGLMAGDRVHYSRDGYERQGLLITDALQRALASR
nr:GDSL-type esterase/lipase family protein [uncultured Porphyromonas sp.]